MMLLGEMKLGSQVVGTWRDRNMLLEHVVGAACQTRVCFWYLFVSFVFWHVMAFVSMFSLIAGIRRLSNGIHKLIDGINVLMISFSVNQLHFLRLRALINV